MDRRMVSSFFLCLVLFHNGCSINLEKRFWYASLGDSLRIQKVEVCNEKQSLFVFSKTELANLEREMGQITVHGFTVSELNDLIVSIKQDFHFTFSDGFKIKAFAEAGSVNGEYILILDLPDDAGFHGGISVFVRLNRVLSQKRLQEAVELFEPK